MTRAELQAAARSWLEGRQIDRETVKAFGVKLIEWSGRPAFRFPTSTGVDRIRFLDDERPKAGWAGTGGGAHWYGLKRAAELLRNGGGDRLYIVNGEPSTWAAAQAGVPATCTSSGESWIPTPDEVAPLRAVLEDAGADVAVAFDLDGPGRRGARSMVAALRGCGIRSTALELPEELGEHGDVDDLHRRVGDEGLGAALAELPELEDVDPFDELLRPIHDLSEHPTPSELQGALEALADNVRAAEPLTRELARGRAVQTLRERGVSSPARVVDAAIVPADGGDETLPDGGGLVREVEPWAEPVDGAELLDDMVSNVRRFVFFGDAAADAVGLWVLFSHAHDAFDISPLLAVTSPTKGCGKSTLLDVLVYLVNRPLSTSNITTASIFRTIELCEPTLLVDEGGTFLTNNDEMRGVLDSGHRRAHAAVIRLVGDDHLPERFSTWAPKAVALIGSLPGTLEDRSIPIDLQRRAPGEEIERLKGSRHGSELAPLARKAARWAEDHLDELRSADPDAPAALHNRALDNWEPLLACADVAGGEWPQRARRAAVELSGVQDPEQAELAVLLLADIRDVFASCGLDKLSSKGLVSRLCDLEERPWSTLRRGQAIDTRKLARILAPFNVHSKTMRFADGSRSKGYERADLAAAFASYLPDTSPSVGTTPLDPCQRDNSMVTGVSGESASVTRSEMSRTEKPRKRNGDGECHGVTATEGGQSEAEGGDDDDLVF